MCWQITGVTLLLLHSNTWNQLTVCKEMIHVEQRYSCLIEILKTIQLHKKGWAQVRLKWIFKMSLQIISNHVWLNNKDTNCLYNLIKSLSSFLVKDVLFPDWNWWMNLPKLSRALSNLSRTKMIHTLVLPLQLFQDCLRCSLMVRAPYPHILKPMLFPNQNFEKL